VNTPLKTTTDKLLKDIYKRTSTLRFGKDIEDNLFHQLNESCKSVIPTFLTWDLTDDVFYYNILKNKDKGPAKRKVTFEWTLIIQSPSILSGKQLSIPRYHTRYQATRSNNSLKKSPDDNDNDDNDDDDNNNQENNLSSNHQQPPNQPSNQPPPNINDGNNGNNPPDKGQNNMIA